MEQLRAKNKNVLLCMSSPKEEMNLIKTRPSRVVSRRCTQKFTNDGIRRSDERREVPLCIVQQKAPWISPFDHIQQLALEKAKHLRVVMEQSPVDEEDDWF